MCNFFLKHEKPCDWVKNSDFIAEYHDKESGIPIHGDDKLFEFITLMPFSQV